MEETIETILQFGTKMLILRPQRMDQTKSVSNNRLNLNDLGRTIYSLYFAK